MFSDVIGAFVLSRLGISINELLGISEGRLIYNTTSKIIHLFLLVIIILFTNARFDSKALLHAIPLMLCNLSSIFILFAQYTTFIDNGKMIKQISSIELESKCRKCTHLKVSSTKTLAYVLDTMNIEYKILSNTEADIFEKVNISKLTTELSKKDCEVISIHEHDESLESYFVSLVGGARHE